MIQRSAPHTPFTHLDELRSKLALRFKLLTATLVSAGAIYCTSPDSGPSGDPSATGGASAGGQASDAGGSRAGGSLGVGGAPGIVGGAGAEAGASGQTQAGGGLALGGASAGGAAGGVSAVGGVSNDGSGGTPSQGTAGQAGQGNTGVYQCQSEANACEQLTLSNCEAAEGCTPIGWCAGTPTDTCSAKTYEQCLEAPNCLALGINVGDCHLAVTSCADLSQSTCGATPGCTWSFDCAARPLRCNEKIESACTIVGCKSGTTASPQPLLPLGLTWLKTLPVATFSVLDVNDNGDYLVGGTGVFDASGFSKASAPPTATAMAENGAFLVRGRTDYSFGPQYVTPCYQNGGPGQYWLYVQGPGFPCAEFSFRVFDLLGAAISGRPFSASNGQVTTFATGQPGQPTGHTVALDDTGVELWRRPTFGSVLNLDAAGNVFLAGYQSTLQNGVMKLDGAGKHRWVSGFDPQAFDRVELAVSREGWSATAFWFSADFSVASVPVKAALNAQNTAVVVFDPNGNLAYVLNLYSHELVRPKLAFGKNNALYIAGVFTEKVTIGDQTSTIDSIDLNQAAVFLASVDKSGIVRQVARIDSEKGKTGPYLAGLDTDAAGNLYVGLIRQQSPLIFPGGIIADTNNGVVAKFAQP